MPLWLSESDVRASLPMAELIDAMQSALIAFSGGTRRAACARP